MDDPYVKKRRNDFYPQQEPVMSVSSSNPRISVRRINTMTDRMTSFDDGAWKPVTEADVGQNEVKEEDDVISESNYWKKIPKFSTSSNFNRKRNTFHWRNYPILSNRRSDGKKSKF